MKTQLITLGTIATIVILIGCSKQSKKDEDAVHMIDGVPLSTWISDFKNRKIHTVLTKQIIDTTANDDLLQVVYDNLCKKLPADYKKEYETVTHWNKHRQAIFMIMALDAEVNNGGYNQFYYNSSGQYYKLLPDALRLIGAKRFAELTKRANSTYEKEKRRITHFQNGTLEGFCRSYDDSPLDTFDSEFGDLYKSEDLNALQIEFIRKHASEFTDTGR